ncbi:hypothetical protein BDV23DRAFT_179307 [Aspergillus alliaceus]|uniref:Xylanolytic transcriptional activator regulatory domain-containing protein n=1 Tax=Petromyces alliaceus TaxID=209559 RepID=A0A5N7CM29_PETAA|nr:hypothetical protein BDV23DRAFT_179307 [Aspergillus alliaceus]
MDGKRDRIRVKFSRRRGACDTCRQRKVKLRHKQHSSGSSQSSTNLAFFSSSFSENWQDLPDISSSQFSFPDSTLLEPLNITNEPIGMPGDSISDHDLQGCLDAGLEAEDFQCSFQGYHERSSSPSKVGEMLEQLFPNAAQAQSRVVDEEADSTSFYYPSRHSILSVLLLFKLGKNISHGPVSERIHSLAGSVLLKMSRLSNATETLENFQARETPNSDSMTVPEYMSNFFSSGRGDFIEKKKIENYIELYLNGSLPEGAPSVLVYALLCLGSWPSPNKTEPRDYLAAAVRSQKTLFDGPPTVTKIQALVALTICCETLGLSGLACGYIMAARELALMLNLNSSSGVKSLITDVQEETYLKNIFWAIYKIEKPLLMREGRLSGIDDEDIDYLPPSKQIADQYTDEEAFAILHSKICSVVMTELWSPRTSLNNADPEKLLGNLQPFLDGWKEQIPELSNTGIHSLSPSILAYQIGSSSSILQQRLETMLKYYETIINIHWHLQRLSPHSSSVIPEECVLAARGILSVTHLLVYSASKPAWLFIHLPLIACCIIGLNALHNPLPRPASPDGGDKALLSMAVGWFGRLALQTSLELGSHEILEFLTTLTQHLYMVDCRTEGSQG